MKPIIDGLCLGMLEVEISDSFGCLVSSTVEGSRRALYYELGQRLTFDTECKLVCVEGGNVVILPDRQEIFSAGEALSSVLDRLSDTEDVMGRVVCFCGDVRVEIEGRDGRVASFSMRYKEDPNFSGI